MPSPLEVVNIYTECPFCGGEKIISVLREDRDKWNGGAFVQDAFPFLNVDDRERLQSGVCPDCFPKEVDEE